MNDPYESLEVAKLAAIMSGQLRRIDKETESSTPANRIDLRKFQQQVVNAANPHAARPVEFGTINNHDEARMLEFLNNEALNKVPELIPNVPPYIPPPAAPAAPEVVIPATPTVATIPSVPMEIQKEIQNPVIAENTSITNSELISYIKSIDSSLKLLCSHFIKTDNIKNKKKQSLKKVKQKSPNPKTTKQILSPISKEMELELLKEINLHQKNIQNVE